MSHEYPQKSDFGTYRIPHEEVYFPDVHNTSNQIIEPDNARQVEQAPPDITPEIERRIGLVALEHQDV